MIYGIGHDLCDVRRVAEALERHGDRFPRRILADGELQTWRNRTSRNTERGVRFLATRFAAKEAFSKAVGLGIRMPMTWRSCEVVHSVSGQPVISLHGELAVWFAQRHLKAHLTLTDEDHLAVAHVVVEQLSLPTALHP
jgi:holo-[acyl-carrier protein] synthase